MKLQEQSIEREVLTSVPSVRPLPPLDTRLFFTTISATKGNQQRSILPHTTFGRDQVSRRPDRSPRSLPKELYGRHLACTLASIMATYGEFHQLLIIHLLNILRRPQPAQGASYQISNSRDPRQKYIAVLLIFFVAEPRGNPPRFLYFTYVYTVVFVRGRMGEFFRLRDRVLVLGV